MAVTDINFLSDLSGSYNNDLPNYKEQVAQTVNRFNNPNLSPVFGTNIQFGVSSFVDKPISPFGSAASGDYVYKNNLGLTSDIQLVKDKTSCKNILWYDNWLFRFYFFVFKIIRIRQLFLLSTIRLNTIF